MASDVEATGGVFDQSSRFSDLARLWREKVLNAQVMAPSPRASQAWALRRLEATAEPSPAPPAFEQEVA